jgi:hypothetical protein
LNERFGTAELILQQRRDDPRETPMGTAAAAQTVMIFLSEYCSMPS